MEPVRLLHTSDVHLGGGFPTPDGGAHRDDCLCPLLALEATVATDRPDVVIVAGDLFDHQRVDDDLVDEVLHRLAVLHPVCVLLNGNHDLHDGRSLYGAAGRPGLVFLDGSAGSLAALDDAPVAVWGRAMDDHHRGFRPLVGVPERPDDDRWWVVVGHGHHEPDLAGGHRSSPIAPDDIAATAADYVALGHWHVRTDVSVGDVTAWYSGAPHGYGASGSFNRVGLDAGGAAVAPVDAVLPAEGCRR